MTSFKRIAALTDIHGDPQRMIELLQEGGILDENGAWISPDTLLVLNGDYVDRGPDGIGVIREAMRLEKAATEGSEVVCIMGNHDAMMLSAVYNVLEGGKSLDYEAQWLLRVNGSHSEEVEALSKAPELIEWLTNLKAVHVEGDYLFQHVDGTHFYRSLGAEKQGENPGTINAALKERVLNCRTAWLTFCHMTDERDFFGTTYEAMREYLNFFGAKQVVHGHTRSKQNTPKVWLRGMAINIDATMSIGYRDNPNRGCLWSVDLTAKEDTSGKT